jgi:hypothetical protein
MARQFLTGSRWPSLKQPVCAQSASLIDLDVTAFRAEKAVIGDLFVRKTKG